MLHFSSLTIGVIAAAIVFDFINGFHDASNAIATIVATRVLKPAQAVLWAALFNFIALFIFGTAVAQTVGSGLVAASAITPLIVLCGLTGAAVWGLITWRLRLPTSSSHALIGSFAGASMAHSAAAQGWRHAADPILFPAWLKIVAFIVIAPVLGMILSALLMRIMRFLSARFVYAQKDSFDRKLQLFSSALLSLMHGGNDAQKTSGIITSALLADGAIARFQVPDWVLALSYATMALGTLMGGWRIVRTMGSRLTKLNARSGVCAESAAAVSILVATLAGLPISTTHVTTGAIIGTGFSAESTGVRWSTVKRIAWGWLLTIPAAAAIGAGCDRIADYLARWPSLI